MSVLTSNQDIVLKLIKSGMNTCYEIAHKTAKTEMSIHVIASCLATKGAITINRTGAGHIYKANAEIVPIIAQHRKSRGKAKREPDRAILSDQPLTEEQKEALRVYRETKEKDRPKRVWLAKFIGLSKPVMMRYLQLEVI